MRDQTRAPEPSKHTRVHVPAAPSTVQELPKSLVAFDTTSAKSNLKLIEFVSAYLDGFSIASTLIPAPDRTKAGLFASIGPIGKRGIGLFEEAGCPAVICGPGAIEQAHAADEFVTIAQLDACMTFLAKLAERFSS